MINLANLQTLALMHGFLTRAKQASDDSEIPESVAAGAGLGGAVGAILPFILARHKHRVSPIFSNERFTTALGALTGGLAGSFAGEWLPRSLEHAQSGYAQGRDIFQKQSNDTFQNASAGALAGAGIGATGALPVLFGRLGRRLPRKLLGKMVLGQAALGAAAGGAAGGIVSREQPRHFYYHYLGTKPSGAKNVSDAQNKI